MDAPATLVRYLKIILMKGFQCFISELIPHCDFKSQPPESEILGQMMDQRLDIFYSGNHSLAKGIAAVNLLFLSL